jgi:hypothetical protein
MSTRARAFALLPLAALGVHQLRYQLAFGHESDHELAAQGHAYLGSLTPVLAFIAALVGAELIFRLARASRGSVAIRPQTRLVVLAGAVAGTLVAIYAAQELLEGFLATGHPDGLAGVFGEGGWWSVPIAIGFGIAIAIAIRGADAAVVALARLRRRRARPVARARDLPRPKVVFPPSPSVLATSAPGRAPPLAVSSL